MSITRVVSVGGLELSNITTSSVSAVRRRFAARLRKERNGCLPPRIKAFSLPGRHRSRSVSVAPWAWAIGTHETERSEFWTASTLEGLSFTHKQVNTEDYPRFVSFPSTSKTQSCRSLWLMYTTRRRGDADRSIWLHWFTRLEDAELQIALTEVHDLSPEEGGREIKLGVAGVRHRSTHMVCIAWHRVSVDLSRACNIQAVDPLSTLHDCTSISQVSVNLSGICNIYGTSCNEKKKKKKKKGPRTGVSGQPGNPASYAPGECYLL